MASGRMHFVSVCCRGFRTSSVFRQPISKTPDYLVTYKKTSEEFLKEKLNNAVSFYQDFTGLRELREAQCRVLVATEMLKEAQDRRREAKLPLSDVQKKLQDIQQELRNTPREDDRYIMLIRDEHGFMKDLKVLQQRLQEAENDERDCFDRLGASLRSSHEAERVQAEKTKYFSIIASILGTLIGVVGSSINNTRRMKELKSLIVESDKEEIRKSLEEIANKVDEFSKQTPQPPVISVDPVKSMFKQEIQLGLIFSSFAIGYALSKLC